MPADMGVSGAMRSGRILRAQANCRPQFFLHRIVEDSSAAAARILHPIANARLL